MVIGLEVDSDILSKYAFCFFWFYDKTRMVCEASGVGYSDLFSYIRWRSGS